MPLANLPAGPLHYVLEGPVSAPAVLFSNSLGTDLHMWDAQAGALREDFCVVRYDTRGHGGSAPVAPSCTIAELGADVVNLLDYLQIRKAHVCGISLGGLTVQWLAVHAPDRVRSAMPCNTSARFGTEESWQQRIDQVREQGMSSLAEATMGRWFTAGFRNTHPDVVDEFKRRFVETGAVGYMACCAALRDADLRSEIGSIAAPTLILSGISDPVTPPADGEFLQSKIAGSEFEAIAGAHLSNVESANLFTSTIKEFLLRQS